MKNRNNIDFFRINQIKGENIYDNFYYIICTEIYFIVFEPLENDKSLGKILFYHKLSDIEFHYEEVGYSTDKNEVKKRLKIIIFEKSIS